LSNRLQAFERHGEFAVALYGSDETKDEELERKLFKYPSSKLSRTREEAMRDRGISYAVSGGTGPLVDWDEGEPMNEELN
jgi:hypothetical protein